MKEELRNIADISTSRMLEADPLESIIRDARNRVEKRIKKALKEKNMEDSVTYLRVYRAYTKFLDREPWDIYDL